MGESAVLFHSYSFAAPLSRHEDNTIHALSQSVSFGRFMTENLEWGRWSSFSHKKYVDEAEKYSQPGSVAQKKAFFEAHYKKIAEAKKAKAVLDESSHDSKQPESVVVLLNTLETLTKDESKEEFAVLSIEKDEDEAERKCVAVVLEQEDKPVTEDDLQAVVDVLDEMELKENYIEEGELPKRNSSAQGKEVIKNSSVLKSETQDNAMELVVTRKISENLMKNNEKTVSPRFSFWKLLMGNTKAQRQNCKRKTDKKPNRSFLCLCFNPVMVGETEGPSKTQRRNL